MPRLRKALFIDKDGTLVQNVPYNVDCDKIQLMSGALEALRQTHAAGYAVVVISNQSGVARGYISIADVQRVERHLQDLLGAGGVPLAGFYYCPHHPDGSVLEFRQQCACRKPAPGLLRRAARELELDLAQSWMIGDILDDVEAGHRAGCRSILYDAGGETEWLQSPLRRPDCVVTDLREAARQILAAESQQTPTMERALHHA